MYTCIDEKSLKIPKG